jgi:hypothetical protein
MLRRCSSRGSRALSTFYDSQSGRMITVPGSSGVRLHARAAPAPPHPRVTSVLCASLELAAAHQRLHASAQAFAPWGGGSDAAPAAAAQLRVGLQLSAACGAAAGLAPAVRAAQALSVPLRVVLLRCFEARPGGDPDANLQQRALEADVALLAAELDVAAIVLSDCAGAATDESLRCAVEEAFYLDVAGETVRERLGVRLAGPQRAALLQDALALGVLRVDSSEVEGEGGEGEVARLAAALPPRKAQ